MKKTDHIKELLIDQLRRTPIVEAACQKANISRMTFYRWKNEDKEFAKKVDEALSDGQLLVNDLAESQLIGAVKDRNFQAIAYWLKHHHPSYKTRIEIEGALNTVHELSPEQEKLMRKAFELAGINIDDYEEARDTSQKSNQLKQINE
ncbi:MAG: hypothetical protein NUV53_03065 [Patescibacteria group bacterium]|nr:hypothetical protein [Patescibacteria group bacterium]